MTDGWIKLYYKMLDWEWMDDPYVVTLWLRILLNANQKDKKWHGRSIKRGQWLTSIHHLAEQTGWSRNTVKRILRILEQSKQIETETDAQGCVITVVNFGKYQNKSGSNADPLRDPLADPLRDPLRDPLADPNIRYKEGEEREEGKKINPPAPARAREEKIGFETFGVIANVFLKAAQHRTLVETFGEQPTANAIDELSCKLADGSFASDNHYATLHYWLSYSRNHARPTAATNPENEDEATRLKTLWDKTPEADKKEYLDAYGCFPWERITTKNAQQ